MIGEIGGAAEEERRPVHRDEAKTGRKKPMVGFIAGDRASRPPHGPCRRHRLRRQGRGAKTRSRRWKRLESRSPKPS